MDQGLFNHLIETIIQKSLTASYIINCMDEESKLDLLDELAKEFTIDVQTDKIRHAIRAKKKLPVIDIEMMEQCFGYNSCKNWINVLKESQGLLLPYFERGNIHGTWYILTPYDKENYNYYYLYNHGEFQYILNAMPGNSNVPIRLVLSLFHQDVLNVLKENNIPILAFQVKNPQIRNLTQSSLPNQSSRPKPTPIGQDVENTYIFTVESYL